MKNTNIIITIILFMLISGISGQETKTVLFDLNHGQNPYYIKNMSEKIDFPEINFKIDSVEITTETLTGIYGLFIFCPTEPFNKHEIDAIISFVNNGGSLFVIYDEERRTPLNNFNQVLQPFDMKLTETIPYEHNCGAVAEESIICAAKRELPYSGGRAVVGGTSVSRVFMEGDYVHCAYKIVDDAKIIVMGDGMAGILLGQPDGVRLTGTKPSDTKYWGKDSQIFMKEILEYFVQ